MLIRVPGFLKSIYPDFVWSFPQKKDSLFLTFDDGPCPEVTPWVLDRLDEYGAKATFFLIGKNVEYNPDLFREILARGHSVGNHTYSHLAGWRVPVDDYLMDICMADSLIGSKLFRPPYAKITPSQARHLSKIGFKVLMWDIIARDYNRKLSGSACTRNVVPHLHPGSVIVFHDSIKASKNLFAALPRTLERIYEMGLRSESLTINDL